MAELELWRIFSRADGTSSMEKIDIPWEGRGTKLFAGTGVMYTRIPKDITPSWHCAPRRQFFITVMGEGIIETGDGQKLIVKPGVMTLLEDLEGKGHMTHAHGDQDRIALVAPLAADTKIA